MVRERIKWGCIDGHVTGIAVVLGSVSSAGKKAMGSEAWSPHWVPDFAEGG